MAWIDPYTMFWLSQKHSKAEIEDMQHKWDIEDLAAECVSCIHRKQEIAISPDSNDHCRKYNNFYDCELSDIVGN